MFICSDSRLEAAEGIDPSLCLVFLGSGICPDPPPLAGPTPDVLHDAMSVLYFPLRGTFLHSGMSVSSGQLGGSRALRSHTSWVSHVLLDGQAGWFTVIWVVQQVGQISTCVCQLQLRTSLRTQIP